jgi:hypothetical protein
MEPVIFPSELRQTRKIRFSYKNLNNICSHFSQMPVMELIIINMKIMNLTNCFAVMFNDSSIIP